jgi:cytochrome c biogenesis protein CcmG, thiol:disulfide interchange protein DsbE
VAERRLPLSAIVIATALALAAALGVLALLGDDEGDEASGAGDAADEGYELPLSPTGEMPGSVAEVRLAALDGGDDRTLGELMGTTPVVVNFFASWCAPCVDEMPAFEDVHQALGDQVSFVGLANQDSHDDALATVAATGVTYPTFDDPDASALTYFGGLTMPTTVFIDAEGEVVDVNSGPLTEAELRAKLDDLFGVVS